MIGIPISNPVLGGVDRKRDWWVAVFPKAKGEPAVVFGIPATDVEAMKKWLIVSGEVSAFVGGGFDVALRDGHHMVGRTDIFMPHRRLRAVISIDSGECRSPAVN